MKSEIINGFEMITSKYLANKVKECVYWNPKTGDVQIVKIKDDEVIFSVEKKVGK